MKKLMFLSALVIGIYGCDKEEQSDINEVELNIFKTETPKVVTLGQPILSRFIVSGPNLCYRFRRTIVAVQAGNRYSIRAIGTVPAGNPVCAQAVYEASATVDITPAARGTYILEFGQYDRMPTKDTVVVQ